MPSNVVVITTEEASEVYLARVREAYTKVYSKLLKPDTSLDIKCVSPGLSRVPDIDYSYFRFLNKGSIIERFIEAEKEGYDAVMVHCFADTGVHEAREILKIPVLGTGESSMLLACQLGSKFGIVTENSPGVVREIETNIKLYGLQDRAIPTPVRRFSAPIRDEYVVWMDDPKLMVPDLMDKAEELVKDGAEVIIIGCGGLAPLATLRGVAKVREKDIPILDCVAITLKTAEMMVDLRTNLGIPVTSRASTYAQPSEKDIARVRAEFGLAEI